MRGIGAMGMNGWILGDFKSLERDTPSKGELRGQPFPGKGAGWKGRTGVLFPGVRRSVDFFEFAGRLQFVYAGGQTESAFYLDHFSMGDRRFPYFFF